MCRVAHRAGPGGGDRHIGQLRINPTHGGTHLGLQMARLGDRADITAPQNAAVRQGAVIILGDAVVGDPMGHTDGAGQPVAQGRGDHHIGANRNGRPGQPRVEPAEIAGTAINHMVGQHPAPGGAHRVAVTLAVDGQHRAVLEQAAAIGERGVGDAAGEVQGMESESVGVEQSAMVAVGGERLAQPVDRPIFQAAAKGGVARLGRARQVVTAAKPGGRQHTRGQRSTRDIVALDARLDQVDGGARQAVQFAGRVGANPGADAVMGLRVTGRHETAIAPGRAPADASRLQQDRRYPAFGQAQQSIQPGEPTTDHTDRRLLIAVQGRSPTIIRQAAAVIAIGIGGGIGGGRGGGRGHGIDRNAGYRRKLTRVCRFVAAAKKASSGGPSGLPLPV